jgi:hypothetical protein
MFLRLVFMGALVAIAIRVSLPQSETFWSVHETLGDLVRLGLGMAVCLWVAVHLCGHATATHFYAYGTHCIVAQAHN